MSHSDATIEDTTLYQTKDTPLAPNPQRSYEVVDRVEQDVQLPSERKNDSGSDEVNAEGTARKNSPGTDVVKKPSQYSLLGAVERLGSSVNQLSCRLSQLDGKISSLETSNRYIMSHLGKLDDRVDSLRSEKIQIRYTIEEVQTEVHNLKKGVDEALDYGGERVGKAESKITASERKRARLA